MGRVEPHTFRGNRGQPLTIRVVEPDEASALLEYLLLIDHSSEHRLVEPGERRTSASEQREWLVHKLAHSRSLAIGAYDDGRLIGFLNFRGHDRRRQAHHGSFGLSVDPDHRRQGIGAALVRVLLNWAAAHPEIEQIRLDVFETNLAGRALYEAMGFREEGRRVREFKLGCGEFVDAVEMCIWVKAI